MSTFHAAIDQAKSVMTHHLTALNAQNAAELATTMHFPHYRLVMAALSHAGKRPIIIWMIFKEEQAPTGPTPNGNH